MAKNSKHSEDILQELREENFAKKQEIPDDQVEVEVETPIFTKEETKNLFSPTTSKGEKPIPPEWFAQGALTHYTTESIVHFYKCALGRQKSYKATFLKEEYKKLADLLLKEIDKRNKQSNLVMSSEE